jgi:hypothetical protein
MLYITIGFGRDKGRYKNMQGISRATVSSVNFYRAFDLVDLMWNFQSLETQTEKPEWLLSVNELQLYNIHYNAEM